MSFKNCPFCVKLGIGFGAVLIFMVILSGMNYLTTNSFKTNMTELQRSTDLEKSMIKKEGDHLKFMARASSFFYEPSMLKMDVETNDHLCALGTWLFGEERKLTENKIPDLLPILISLQDHHALLHRSIAKINTLTDGVEKDSILAEAKSQFNDEAKPALAGVREELSKVILVLEKHAEGLTANFSNDINSSKRKSFFLTLGAIVIGVLSSFFVTRSVSFAIKDVVSVNEQLAQGNMTVRSSVDQKDEMGMLALAANTLAVNIGLILKKVRGSSSTIHSSTGILDNLSGNLAVSAEEMAALCNTTAAASEQMDSNMSAIAAASEQTSTNISMVAAAAEELTATVSEIADNAENARVITSNAVEEAAVASTFISELDLAANEINKVTETINEIADQTNLLALNATIEAARAGEAGKGFAVVANEIKELAKQTTEATREIKQRIDGVQESSDKTIAAINSITKTITNSNNVVSGMAAAVEEQAVTTQEIAENISQASVGMQEVNKNIAQATMVNKEVTNDVGTIQGQAHNVSASSTDVKELAAEMNHNALDLETIVTQFTIEEARFDIGIIKAAHFNWKMKLTAVLNGYQQIQSSDVPDHHQCDFGKWYDSAPAELTALPVFKQMGVHHENVHKRVMEAVDAHNEDRDDEAKRKVAEFEKERMELFRHLDQLYVS